MKDLQGCISLVLSGHYVPQLAQLIYEQNKGIQNPIINLKGFMVDL
jgi:carboxypeptidase C (cathepsin A)